MMMCPHASQTRREIAAASIDETSPELASRRIKSAAALFETVFSPARYVVASDALSMRVYEAVMSILLSRGGSTETTARIAVACIGTDKRASRCASSL